MRAMGCENQGSGVDYGVRRIAQKIGAGYGGSENQEIGAGYGMREPGDWCGLWGSENQTIVADFGILRSRRLLLTIGF